MVSGQGGIARPYTYRGFAPTDDACACGLVSSYSSLRTGDTDPHAYTARSRGRYTAEAAVGLILGVAWRPPRSSGGSGNPRWDFVAPSITATAAGLIRHENRRGRGHR